MFEALFNAKVNELRTMFLATSGVFHNGEKGGFRETFVRSLLQQFLPIQFGIGSGVIVDKWGRQSPQVDIIIYDKRNMPPILDQGGHGIYPLDSVLRALEVKSTVDSAAISQFSRLAWSLHPKNLSGLKLASVGTLEGGEGYYPLCGMFGFNTKIADLPKAYRKEEVLLVNPALIYVDGHGYYNCRTQMFFKPDDIDDGVRMFVGNFIARVEEAAKSRSEFRPLDWFSIPG
jgi:hypothetical protein